MRTQDSNFWLSNQVDEFFHMANAQQRLLQPYIASLIGEMNPRTLLDYGCGDGFVHKLVEKPMEIHLYDINSEELCKSCQYLADLHPVSHEDETTIPRRYFDCILFSLVLVCLNTEAEYERILRNLIRYKKKNGKLIFVTSHPCFRQYEYRAFYSSYARRQEFSYFNELEPFDMFMKDDGGKIFRFTDHHWTLSTTINKLTEAGFTLEKMIELRDDSFDGLPCNRNFSPFMVLICK